MLYQRIGKGVVVNEVVLNSVGPEHDVNGMEYAGFSTGRVNFLHS